MKEVILTVSSNDALTEKIFELKLKGEVSGLRAGTFVEVQLDGFYLRRPFGVADCADGVLTLIYRVQGKGTDAMTSLKPNDKVNVLIGLGNGFNTADLPKNPLLIGGGMGVAPLYFLAKTLNNSGVRPKVILGFKSASEAFYIEKFMSVADVTVVTDDGTLGGRGNVLDALKNGAVTFDYYYACGPVVMLKNLQAFSTLGEMSLEARMGCGFGACMGCSILTVGGVAKRVCKEGPVFKASEVIF